MGEQVKPEEKVAMKIEAYTGMVQGELEEATNKFGPFASAHEGLAIIEEEFEEFKTAVFWGVDQHGNPSDPRDEAIQLAAMAIRFLVDIDGKQVNK
jgi:hypothetical protein